jgi:hypothetical protein
MDFINERTSLLQQHPHSNPLPPSSTERREVNTLKGVVILDRDRDTMNDLSKRRDSGYESATMPASEEGSRRSSKAGPRRSKGKKVAAKEWDGSRRKSNVSLLDRLDRMRDADGCGDRYHRRCSLQPVQHSARLKGAHDCRELSPKASTSRQGSEGTAEAGVFYLKGKDIGAQSFRSVHWDSDTVPQLATHPPEHTTPIVVDFAAPKHDLEANIIQPQARKQSATRWNMRGTAIDAKAWLILCACVWVVCTWFVVQFIWITRR